MRWDGIDGFDRRMFVGADISFLGRGGWWCVVWCCEKSGGVRNGRARYLGILFLNRVVLDSGYSWEIEWNSDLPFEKDMVCRGVQVR